MNDIINFCRENLSYVLDDGVLKVTPQEDSTVISISSNCLWLGVKYDILTFIDLFFLDSNRRADSIITIHYRYPIIIFDFCDYIEPTFSHCKYDISFTSGDSLARDSYGYDLFPEVPSITHYNPYSDSKPSTSIDIDDRFSFEAITIKVK